MQSSRGGRRYSRHSSSFGMSPFAQASAALRNVLPTYEAWKAGDSMNH